MKNNKIYNIATSKDNRLRAKQISVIAAGVVLATAAFGGMGFAISNIVANNSQADAKNAVKKGAYKGHSILWKNVERYHNFLIANNAFFSDTTINGPGQIGGIYDTTNPRNSTGAFKWFKDYYSAIFYFILKDATLDISATANDYANAMYPNVNLNIAPLNFNSKNSNSDIYRMFSSANPQFFGWYALNYQQNNRAANPNSTFSNLRFAFPTSGTTYDNYSVFNTKGPISDPTNVGARTTADPYNDHELKPNLSNPSGTSRESNTQANSSEIIRALCQLAMAIAGTTFSLFNDKNLDPSMPKMYDNYIRNSDNESIMNPYKPDGTLSNYNRLSAANNWIKQTDRRNNVYNNFFASNTSFTSSFLNFFLSPIFIGRDEQVNDLNSQNLGSNGSRLNGADSLTGVNDYSARDIAAPVAGSKTWSNVSILYSPIAYYGGILNDKFAYNINAATGAMFPGTPQINSGAIAKLTRSIDLYFGFWKDTLITSPASSGQKFVWNNNLSEAAIYNFPIANKANAIENLPNYRSNYPSGGAAADNLNLNNYVSVSPKLTLSVVNTTPDARSQSQTYVSPIGMLYIREFDGSSAIPNNSAVFTVIPNSYRSFSRFYYYKNMRANNGVGQAWKSLGNGSSITDNDNLNSDYSAICLASAISNPTFSDGGYALWDLFIFS